MFVVNSSLASKQKNIFHASGNGYRIVSPDASRPTYFLALNIPLETILNTRPAEFRLIPTVGMYFATSTGLDKIDGEYCTVIGNVTSEVPFFPNAFHFLSGVILDAARFPVAFSKIEARIVDASVLITWEKARGENLELNAIHQCFLSS